MEPDTHRWGEELASRRGRWARRVVIGGLLWALLTLGAAAVSEPTPQNLALLLGIVTAGLYTLGLYMTRRRWLQWLSGRARRNAVLLGSFNAAVVETEILLFAHLFGAADVAAHPNLAIDLLLTMPWYVLMLRSFVSVQHRRRFTPATVLLLGAVYETCADGGLGPLLASLFGESRQLLDPTYWLLLGLIAFWQFIPVYSSLVLPPSWLVATVPRPAAPATAAWRDALRPLLWLVPFAIYVLVLSLVLQRLNLA